ncbi:helix-turn-helix domain-containing protein [Polaribacter aquimarinus]|uniref:DNA-binding protein n=1 Tax=Polaribacter aquimarinus TaxID=2100726 RepID=A0A2U2JDZ6_9FLAO|nr:helix-turn-helix domain-containing protein [Polaribacter aquimarinus]PWG06570.1 DNA-binding protein [Polaribacter aquimarinus]
MAQIQFVQTSPEENRKPLLDYIDKKFEDFKEHFEPKTPNQYLTRQEVSNLLSVDLSTVHNWSKRKILKPKQIGGRVLYLRSEVEDAIIELKK